MGQSGPKDHSNNELLSINGHSMMLRFSPLLFIWNNVPLQSLNPLEIKAGLGVVCACHFQIARVHSVSSKLHLFCVRPVSVCWSWAFNALRLRGVHVNGLNTDNILVNLTLHLFYNSSNMAKKTDEQTMVWNKTWIFWRLPQPLVPLAVLQCWVQFILKFYHFPLTWHSIKVIPHNRGFDNKMFSISLSVKVWRSKQKPMHHILF